MPRFNSYTLATTHPFAASTTTRVILPLSGFITHIDHLLRLNITTAGGATVLEDAAYRLLRATRILAAGSKTFFTHSLDARLWHYWNMHRYLGQLHADLIPSAAGGPANFDFYLPLHLGFDPLNIFDGKVVIPARDLQNLVEEIVWGVSADIGVAQTVNAAGASFLELTINEVALEPGESVAQFFPAGFLLPRFESRQTAIAIQSNLGTEDDVPVGDTLFHTLVLLLTAGGVRSDVEASEIGVKFPKVREIPMQMNWLPWLYQARALFSQPATNAGVALFPWERISRDPFGLDLTKAQVGDVKLALTTIAAGGSFNRLHYALG